MTNQRPELYAWIIAILTLVSIVVLTLTSHPVPNGLWALLSLAVGGALGLTSPISTQSVAQAVTTAAESTVPAASVAVSDQAAPVIVGGPQGA